MNDSYAEWLVKCKTPFYAHIVNAIMAILTAISVFLAFTTTVFAVILMFAVGFATYILYRNSHVEYEYLYVDGQLTIDKILGKAKRKKAWEGTMNEIQIIAPSDSFVLNDYRSGQSKVLDFSSHIPGSRTYTAIVQAQSGQERIIFEPNDKMIQCFRQTSPRKVVQ